jgi:hypothetical protein
MSRVKKNFPYYKIYSYNLTEIRQKETSRAMERFFPSRVIKMQYKLQNKLSFFFKFFEFKKIKNKIDLLCLHSTL